MKEKIKPKYKVNTMVDMFSIDAKKDEVCLVSGKYYQFDGTKWEIIKNKK